MPDGTRESECVERYANKNKSPMTSQVVRREFVIGNPESDVSFSAASEICGIIVTF
jgi:hypothetical protein